MKWILMRKDSSPRDGEMITPLTVIEGEEKEAYDYVMSLNIIKSFEQEKDVPNHWSKMSPKGNRKTELRLMKTGEHWFIK